MPIATAKVLKFKEAERKQNENNHGAKNAVIVKEALYLSVVLRERGPFHLLFDPFMYDEEKIEKGDDVECRAEHGEGLLGVKYGFLYFTMRKNAHYKLFPCFLRRFLTTRKKYATAMPYRTVAMTEKVCWA